MPVFPLPGMPNTPGLILFETTMPKPQGQGSTEVPKPQGQGSTEVPKPQGEGSTEVPKTQEGSTEVPKKLGGSIAQVYANGEYLMRVFTKMLEILNEKKIE